MLLGIIKSVTFLTLFNEDDFVDRLSYYYTTTLLIFGAILISFKNFIGQPLDCWVPAEYRGSWKDYTGVFRKFYKFFLIFNIMMLCFILKSVMHSFHFCSVFCTMIMS
jgi:hypothetical protein